MNMLLPPEACPKLYDDSQWKQQIELANDAFRASHIGVSFRHYLNALFIAKQLFVEFQHHEPLPDALTPVLVISYLNLSTAWAQQGNRQEERACLLEIYDHLLGVLEGDTVSDALQRQVYQGLSKVHYEQCAYLKKNSDLRALERKKKDFSTLTDAYLRKTWPSH